MAESSQNLTPKEKLLIEKKNFFQKFTQLLEKGNIIEDNIYTMIEIKFTLKFRLLDDMKKTKEITNMKNLEDDSLTIMFCTNATGCHKLLPFCTYTYNDEGAMKYLKNTESPFLQNIRRSALKTKKGSTDEINELKTKEARDNFVDWYNNYFTKFVRDHQKVKGKVLLLLSKTARFISEEIIKDNSFEILYIPKYTIETFQPLDQKFRNKIRYQYRFRFPYFCMSGDIKNLIIEIQEPWTNLTPVDIQKLYQKLFEPDFLTKEYNITEKDTAEEISKPQSSGETERDKQEHQENAENSESIENIESTKEKIGDDYLTLKRELDEKSSNYIDFNKVPDLKCLLRPSSSSDDSTESWSSFGKAEGEGTSGIGGKKKKY